MSSTSSKTLRGDFLFELTGELEVHVLSLFKKVNKLLSSFFRREEEQLEGDESNRTSSVNPPPTPPPSSS